MYRNVVTAMSPDRNGQPEKSRRLAAHRKGPGLSLWPVKNYVDFDVRNRHINLKQGYHCCAERVFLCTFVWVVRADQKRLKRSSTDKAFLTRYRCVSLTTVDNRCRYFCITHTTVGNITLNFFLQYVGHTNEWNHCTSHK